MTNIGPLEPSPGPLRPAAGVDERDDGRFVILFVSTNGVGVGHLMRLMAMARRARTNVVPVFVTMSQALAVVRQAGYPVEYIPSLAASRLSMAAWQILLRRRLLEIIDFHGPAALVFDGTHPYRGLLRTMRARPDVVYVWSRRAMWHRSQGVRFPDVASDFDLVLEPGEIAEEFDEGPTVARRPEALRVGPVLYAGPEEALTRGEARRELGLAQDRPAVLVQLGAGNINELGSLLGMVVDRLSRTPDLQIVLAQSAISEGGSTGRDVHRVSVYPLSRYLAAFDFAVAASGYNTFHELAAAGVPTVFFPNLETRTDNQQARAAFAAARGFGVSLTEHDPEVFDAAVAKVIEDGPGMAARARMLFPGNDARSAMLAIEECCARRRSRSGASQPRSRVAAPVASPQTPRGGKRRSLVRRWVSLGEQFSRRLPTPLKRLLRPGAYWLGERLLPAVAIPTLLVVLDGEESDTLDQLDVLAAVGEVWGTRIVVVTKSEDLSLLRQRGFTPEHLPSHPFGESTDGSVPWEDFASQRFRTLFATYRPRVSVTVSPSTNVTLLRAYLEGGLSRRRR